MAYYKEFSEVENLYLRLVRDKLQLFLNVCAMFDTHMKVGVWDDLKYLKDEVENHPYLTEEFKQYFNQVFWDKATEVRNTFLDLSKNVGLRLMEVTGNVSYYLDNVELFNKKVDKVELRKLKPLNDEILDNFEGELKIYLKNGKVKTFDGKHKYNSYVDEFGFVLYYSKF